MCRSEHDRLSMVLSMNHRQQSLFGHHFAADPGRLPRSACYATVCSRFRFQPVRVRLPSAPLACLTWDSLRRPTLHEPTGLMVIWRRCTVPRPLWSTVVHFVRLDGQVGSMAWPPNYVR